MESMHDRFSNASVKFVLTADITRRFSPALISGIQILFSTVGDEYLIPNLSLLVGGSFLNSKRDQRAYVKSITDTYITPRVLDPRPVTLLNWAVEEDIDDLELKNLTEQPQADYDDQRKMNSISLRELVAWVTRPEPSRESPSDESATTETAQHSTHVPVSVFDLPPTQQGTIIVIVMAVLSAIFIGVLLPAAQVDPVIVLTYRHCRCTKFILISSFY
jgi:hypothetical protein